MEIDKFGNKNYSKVSSLISAIVLFIIGSIIFTNPNGTIKFVANILGIAFIILGLFKIFINYKNKGNEGTHSIKDLSIGVISLVAGLLLVIFSSTVEALIRVIVGAFILFNGINLLTSAIRGLKNKVKSSKVLLTLSILMIIGGIYMILKSNIMFSMIGLFIMIYSVIEIIGYICYTQSN